LRRRLPKQSAKKSDRPFQGSNKGMIIHGLRRDWGDRIQWTKPRSECPMTTLKPIPNLSLIHLDDWSEPEPDLAIVQGTVLDYGDRHPGPNDIELVVEVAYFTLKQDCEIKDKLYAQAGIADYWILLGTGSQKTPTSRFP
jgi:Putative restriction endonuclease